MILSLWRKYFQLLEKKPITTNLVTSFFVGFTGDVLAQKLESDKVKTLSDIVYQRSTKVGIAFILSAVPFFYWYRMLDSRFPTTLSKNLSLKSALKRVVPKVAANQCIAAPINNTFIYAYITTWDHYFNSTSFEPKQQRLSLWGKIKSKWLLEMPTTTKYSFMIWGPVHTLNFIFLPTQTRVLFNSVGSTCWVAYLSIRGHADRRKHM